MSAVSGLQQTFTLEALRGCAEFQQKFTTAREQEERLAEFRTAIFDMVDVIEAIKVTIPKQKNQHLFARFLYKKAKLFMHEMNGANVKYAKHIMRQDVFKTGTCEISDKAAQPLASPLQPPARMPTYVSHSHRTYNMDTAVLQVSQSDIVNLLFKRKVTIFYMKLCRMSVEYLPIKDMYKKYAQILAKKTRPLIPVMDIMIKCYKYLLRSAVKQVSLEFYRLQN